MNLAGPPLPPHVYHERQVKALCAVHALNNLFQEKGAFDKKVLDGICHSLDPNSWVNVHRSLWGIGDYDLNIIESAILTRGYVMQWFDRRLNPLELVPENIFGYIMNVPGKKRTSIFNWLPLTSQRHWYALRNLPTPGELQQGIAHFYNLDSNLEQPRSMGQRSQLVHFVKEQMNSEEKHLFLIVTSEVKENGSWRRPLSPIVSTEEADAAFDLVENVIEDLDGYGDADDEDWE